jgi:hypothetical protein
LHHNSPHPGIPTYIVMSPVNTSSHIIMLLHELVVTAADDLSSAISRYLAAWTWCQFFQIHIFYIINIIAETKECCDWLERQSGVVIGWGMRMWLDAAGNLYIFFSFVPLHLGTFMNCLWVSSQYPLDERYSTLQGWNINTSRETQEVNMAIVTVWCCSLIWCQYCSSKLHHVKHG